MTVQTIVPLAFLIIGFGILLWIAGRKRPAGAVKVGDFEDRVVALDPVAREGYEKQRLFAQYLVQQKFAFALLWSAVLCSLLIGFWLLWEIRQRGFSMEMMGQVVGVMGGVGISYSAWRLYDRATTEIKELIAMKF
jgi:hypothetical protein